MSDIVTLPATDFKHALKTVLTSLSANDAEFYNCREISDAMAKQYGVDSEALIRRVSNLLSGEHRAKNESRIITNLQRLRIERSSNGIGGSYLYRVAL